MKTAVTIKDIADQLGLSRNTVAKVLNGKYAPEKTREAVLSKARELNYKSIGSGEAAPHKSKRILLLSGKPLINLNFFVPIIKSIENFCFDHHHELFQYTFNGGAMTFSGLKDYINGLSADGIIAIETFDKDFISKLIGLGLPLAFIDFAPISVPITGNYDIIRTSNASPIAAITHQLHVVNGIKRFCFVGDVNHCQSFRDRYFGMLQALAYDSVAHSRRDDILRSDKFNYGSTDAVKSEINHLRALPECFICANDFIARSVCNALADSNIPVPQKCAVVGFDNTTEAYSSSPEITSFGCNNEYLGTEAVTALLDRIVAKQSKYTRTVTVHVKQYSRESTQFDGADKK